MKMNSRSVACWILVGSSVLIAVDSFAQEVVVSAPAPAIKAPVLRESTSPTQSAPSESTDAAFQWGPLSLHPHLQTKAVYGMGLPSQDGRRVASMIYTLAPGIQMDLGQSWSFDYTPTWTTYTARAMEDTVGHSARLSGAWMMQDWAVQISENYGESSPLLAETGGQTPQRNWATQLGASRSFGSDLSFQTLASLDERYGDSFPDTRDWATMNWLTLRVTPQLETGLGLGAGYSDIVGEPDATNERYMGKVRWNPTAKLGVDINAGLEMRHSRAAQAEDQNNPIYNATLIYRPFSVTQITLGASNVVTNSYYQNQVTENTGWNLGIQQRLLERFFFNAAYSQQETEFSAVSAVPPAVLPADPSVAPQLTSLPGRSDEIEAFNFRLFTTLLKRWNIAATYAHSKNHSSQSGFAYRSSQYGIELSCRF